MKSAVIVPGDAPPWLENHARHIAQRLTSRGRVVVAFTHEPTRPIVLPGHSEQSSLLGHSASGYPLWMGRISAVMGFRRRADDTVLVLWNGANAPMALVASLVSRLRRERLTVVVAERPDTRSFVERRLRTLIAMLARNVVELTAETNDVEMPFVALAICGDDLAFADLVLRSAEAMSDVAAHGWKFILHVTGIESDMLQIPAARERNVVVRQGEISKQSLLEADVVITPDRSPMKNIVSETVLLGGVGILVGGPVAGRIFRQPDGVWLAKHDCASLIVAFEASTNGVIERPQSVRVMRVLAEDVVAVLDAASSNGPTG